MKTFLILAIIAAGSFFAGRTYERSQQQPVIEERVAAARRSLATPSPQRTAWMYAPDRHTALDEPPKTVGRYRQ